MNKLLLNKKLLIILKIRNDLNMVNISIIIPLYNKEKYIKTCLSSALQQTYQDYEIIIVDDGSTDSSVKIINENFQSKIIRIISQKNSGPAAARNRGVIESSGQWILFLDADDQLLPWALEKFVSLIDKHKDISYFICNYYLYSKGNYILFSFNRYSGIVRTPFLLEFFDMLTDRPGSAIYEKQLLLKFPFDRKLRRYEDAECQYRILNAARVYQSSIPVMISNRDASRASSPISDINKDFIGHIDFNGKTFWERLQLYKLIRFSKDSYGKRIADTYVNSFKNSIYSFMYYLYKIYAKMHSLFIHFHTYSYEEIINKRKDHEYNI